MRYILVALAVALAACGADPDVRDYAWTGPCPVPTEPRGSMCDDGAGRTPRFVSVETCSAEAGRPVPAGWFVRIVMGTHPAAARCAPSVYLFTYADIRDGGSLTH